MVEVEVEVEVDVGSRFGDKQATRKRRWWWLWGESG